MKTLRLAGALWVIGMLGLPVVGSAQLAAPRSNRAAEALPATIPIFPLEDVVLFPNSSVPLHIFEPRYREMIADALVGDGIIGMILLRPGYEADYYGRPPVYAVGCAGTIIEAEELSDGRYMILLGGLVRFRVTREDRSRAYRLADVEPLPEVLDDQRQEILKERREDRSRAYRLADVEPLPEVLDDQRQEILKERRRRLAGMRDAISGLSPLFNSLSDEEFVDRLSQVLTLSPAGRQSLLELDGLVERADALVEFLVLRTAVPL